jgi:hypothetical protein
VQAGFNSRNSGRRLQTFSTRNSNGNRFSPNTSRTFRENGDRGRWNKTRMAVLCQDSGPLAKLGQELLFLKKKAGRPQSKKTFLIWDWGVGGSAPMP